MKHDHKIHTYCPKQKSFRRNLSSNYLANKVRIQIKTNQSANAPHYVSSARLLLSSFYNELVKTVKKNVQDSYTQV